MAHYEIKPEPSRVYGSLSRDFPPALRIHPGDSVTFQALEADWRVARPPEPKTESGDFFPSRQLPRDAGHALCGPVYIEGAQPGMTLRIRIDEVVPASWGWSRIGGGNPDHMRRIGWTEEEYFELWDIDAAAGTCTNLRGQVIPMNPFPGVLAVCPDSETPVITHLPGIFGANLDCKEIRAGCTLSLPIFVEGALFFTGDGHAAQGDGESGCTAIECPMDRLTYTFDLADEQIDSPICETPDGWITFGFNEDLTDATYEAFLNMVSLMQRLLGIPRGEALNLASMVVDLRITQIVNGIRGAHACLPKDKLNGI